MIVIGIGDVAYSDDQTEQIITHALGSCVAVIIHCVSTKRTAMAHVVLPTIQNTTKPIKEAYYADSALKDMLTYFLKDNRCRKSYLNIHLIGGAGLLNEHDLFQVGRKNVMVLSDMLRKNYIQFDATDTGGNYSRTVRVAVKNGKIKVDRKRMLI